MQSGLAQGTWSKGDLRLFQTQNQLAGYLHFSISPEAAVGRPRSCSPTGTAQELHFSTVGEFSPGCILYHYNCLWLDSDKHLWTS